MLDLVFILSIVMTIVQLVKEFSTKEIPAEYWGNKELYYKDMIDGVPIEQRMKNLENGKYRMVNNHPKPHRDPVSGKIIIENCTLYYEDARKYGACKAQEWVKQGKYNLSPEELEMERERIRNRKHRVYTM